MTTRHSVTLPYPHPPTWQGTSPSHDCTVFHSPNYIPHNSNVRILPTPPHMFLKCHTPGVYIFSFKPLRTFVRTLKLLNVTAVTALQNDTSQTTCFGFHQGVYPHTWDCSVI